LTTPLRAERWTTPDDDVLDLRRLDPPAGASDETPHIVFLHGLEGGVHSHYVANLFAEVERRGWGADLILFRGCAGELNRARRFYHSGETTDFDFALRRIVAERSRAPIGLAGVSLGGNVLLKWLGEQGGDVPAAVRGAVAISVPFDLARGSRHISRGFSRVYERFFLRSLVAKARAKLTRHPDLCDATALDRVRTLWDFDDVLTAPVHGFRDARDYYAQSSSIHFLSRIRVPTLLLSALDDPFLPRDVLDEVRSIAAGNPALELEFVRRGGHVGFVSGRVPWRPVFYAEWRVGDFLARRFAQSTASSGSQRSYSSNSAAADERR
jgi:predicted alpha/beta-fold hydrolase